MKRRILSSLMALVLVFMAIRVYSKVPMTEEQFQNRKRMSKKKHRKMLRKTRHQRK